MIYFHTRIKRNRKRNIFLRRNRNHQLWVTTRSITKKTPTTSCQNQSWNIKRPEDYTTLKQHSITIILSLNEVISLRFYTIVMYFSQPSGNEFDKNWWWTLCQVIHISHVKKQKGKIFTTIVKLYAKKA